MVSSAPVENISFVTRVAETVQEKESVPCVARQHDCSADLWLLVKPGDVPLHHLLHPVVGVLFNCRPRRVFVVI